jgi:Mrp family chromosome partitioning ATPase
MSQLSAFPAPVRSKATKRYLGKLPHCPVADTDMVTLLRRIHEGAPGQGCRVIEVVSANGGEGVSSIVRGLARVATSNVGLRVLICDVSPTQSAIDDLKPQDDPVTLAEVSAIGGDLNRAVYWIHDTNIAVCALSNEGSGSRMAVDIELSHNLISALRPTFDLILLDAPPICDSPVGHLIAKATDGVVLVMASESTRVHSAAAARTQIEAADGRVIGVVFNKRRFYIPQSLYRRL